jgi:hypothetical protein
VAKQQRLYEALVDDLRDGHVAVIAGAGVTMAATKSAPTAGWTGLLQHGVHYCRDVNPTLDQEWEDRL